MYNRNPQSKQEKNSELIKIVLWYDNEYGYSCNVINQIKHINSLIKLNNKVS